MNNYGDNPPKEQEVFVIDVLSASPSHVTLNIRIRTEETWTYLRNVTLEVGDSLAVLDEQATNFEAHPNVGTVERLPRTKVISHVSQ
jgi:hypothetical protein